MINYILAYFHTLFFTTQTDLIEPIPRLWTDDEISTALSMTVNNCSLDQIARTINRTESAVYQKLRKLHKKESSNA